MKTSHRAGSFRGIWGEKPAKKPPSDEGGGICEANDGGRDWVEGASPRPTWCVISWRLMTSAGAEVGAPSRRAPRKKASPFQGEAVERSETDEGAHGGDAPLIAPSSGPAGHLPPCGGKACGASRRPPLRRRKLHTPQGGLSWPFGPIHLLVRFRLAAKAPSFRCSDSPHATRFAGLARGPHIFSLQTGRRPPVGAHIVRPLAAESRPNKTTKEEFSCPPTTPQITT